MKKRLACSSILTLASVITLTGCGVTLAASIIQNQYNPDFPGPKDNTEIPPDDLKIINNVLYGFKDNVTFADLKAGGYDTLNIPEGVVEIADFAFAEMFDWDPGAFPSGLCYVSKLILPSSLKKIGNYAFKDCIGLDCEVTLPSSLEYVGNEAFYYCAKIKIANPVFPNSLVHIGHNAFRLCDGITGTITFNPELTEVGYSAFALCNGISGLDFSNYASIPGWLYKPYQYIFQDIGIEATDEKNISISVAINNEDEWKDVLEKRQFLPEGFTYKHTKELAEDKFKYKDSSKKEIIGFVDDVDLSEIDIIRIPSSVQSIEPNAFYDSDKKTGKIKKHVKLILNENLSLIGDNAFNDCNGIVGELVLPSSLQTIGAGAFAHCTGLSGTLSLTNLNSIPESCFEGCVNISKLYIGQTVESVGKKAFNGCSNLSIIDVTDFREVPDWSAEGEEEEYPFFGLPSIGQVLYANIEGLFENWQGLFFELGHKHIESWSFYTNDIMNVVFPEDAQIHTFVIADNSIVVGMTEIRREAIDNYCILQFPNQITEITSQALKEIFLETDENHFWFLKLNDGLGEIGDSAFENNPGLIGSLSLPNSVRSIGKQAFYNCTGFKGQVIFPVGLMKLGDQAFESTKIKNIKISSTNLTLGNNVFANCQDLDEIDLTDLKAPPKWSGSGSSFSGLKESGVVYVSDTTKDWRAFFTNLGLPNGWEIRKR